MEYPYLGETGSRASELCFGTRRFGMKPDGTTETSREEAHDLLDTAWDTGINFIDTANVYGDPAGRSERWIGGWLEENLGALDASPSGEQFERIDDARSS